VSGPPAGVAGPWSGTAARTAVNGGGNFVPALVRRPGRTSTFDGRERAGRRRHRAPWSDEAGQGWGLSQLIVAVRWAALCLSLLTMALGKTSRSDVVTATILAVYAVGRTVWPLRVDWWEPRTGRGGWSALLGAVVELAVCVAAVGATGGFTSPFLISLGAAAFVVGLRLPPSVLVAAAVVGVAALTGCAVVGALSHSQAKGGIERLAVLGAVAMLGSYSDWLLRAGRRSRGEEVEWLRNLSDVNHLLLELHAKAASLPASLNLRAAIANTLSRLRDLLNPDVVVLLLADPNGGEGSDRWQVTLAEGVTLPQIIAGSELPAAMAEATRSLGPVRRSSLEEGEGMALEAATGLYAPLWARNNLIGLLSVERAGDNEAFDERDREIVAGVARHAALAIDNARWFRRLRTLGAEEERGRIARELHDRVGQSLAFVAISLDRLAGESRNLGGLDNDAASELADLAGEVRKAAREIRTKLSDLRIEVGDGTDLAEALAGLLERVEQRSGIATSLSADGEVSLPPVIEREVARIAQEAITNAERHSGAMHIAVRFCCEDEEAVLEVVDDGKGMAATAPLRRDAFGILGMRERADAIGATLTIASPPRQGTTVRLRLGQPEANDGRWHQ
jgi:signal transduction histidine kinase